MLYRTYVLEVVALPKVKRAGRFAALEILEREFGVMEGPETEGVNAFMLELPNEDDAGVKENTPVGIVPPGDLFSVESLWPRSAPSSGFGDTIAPVVRLSCLMRS